MDPLWCDNIKILYQKDRLMEFWPTKMMHLNERVNSCSRFVMYAGVILAFLKADPILLLGAVAIALALVGVARSGTIDDWSQSKQAVHSFPDSASKTHKKCTSPTKENPFANVLLTDDPTRAPACDAATVETNINDAFFDGFQQDPYDIFNKKHSQRQFFSTANTMTPNDQRSFAEWCYGSNNKRCKEDNAMCSRTEAFGS